MSKDKNKEEELNDEEIKEEKNLDENEEENNIAEETEDEKFSSENLNEDYKEKYLRAIADYQNLIKQNAKEKTEFIKYAVEGFLEEILPVYDHLKLSIKNLNEEEEKSAWVEGVKHVLKQFKEILNSKGVEEIKTLGEKFDHNLMEAVEGEGDIVVKEVMSGYMLNKKVIRAARVVVGQKEEK